MWFHLSPSDNLGPVINEVFVPKIAHGETGIARFPIAPTVSQCIISTPSDGLLYIYEVCVAAPVHADESVMDRDLTDEHWITDEVREREGGEIHLRRIGKVRVCGDLRLNLKFAIRGKGYRFNAEQERMLWDVSCDEWRAKFEDVDDIGKLLNLARGSWSGAEL